MIINKGVDGVLITYKNRGVVTDYLKVSTYTRMHTHGSTSL